MNVKLIRHTSVAVPSGICYGQTDVPLKASFETEAEIVRQMLDGLHFEAVFTSPLSRCTKLAAYCGFADATCDDRLKEIDFGEWEMKRYDDITDPRLQLWYDDYINTRATGGESFADQKVRLEAFLTEKKSQGLDNILIFAHAGILMQAMLISGKYTLSEVMSNQPGYGEIIDITL